MVQVISTLTSEGAKELFCSYINATGQIQIARISNISNWYFERVIFPGQRLLFNAPQAAQLEIHTGKLASAILTDTIPCDRLQVTQPAD